MSIQGTVNNNMNISSVYMDMFHEKYPSSQPEKLELLEFEKKICHMYTNTFVNVRKNPNIESDILIIFRPNVKVNILEYKDGWYKICFRNESCEPNYNPPGIGYIKSQYLSVNRIPVSKLNQWGIELSNEEVDLLAQILWVEARGEPYEGQVAVIEVIFNRMISNNNDFPDNDLIGTVSSKKNGLQFDSWRLRNTASPDENTYQVIYDVLGGVSEVLPSTEYVFFSQYRIGSNIIKIGGHYFGT